MRAHTFEVSSVLALPASDFWAHATLADVNAELAPWVRMTAPVKWRATPLRQWPAGQRLFNSTVLLFGFLPVDLHFFYLKTIDLSGGFEERSSSLMNTHWDHDRRVAPQGTGCRVIDRVTYESRLPLIGGLMLPIYRAIFASRHRFLRRTHGELRA